MALVTAPDAIVVGAGCAGLSAASRLTAAGRRVLVLEARSRLGGRATSFADRDSGELVDNGQHILLGCYTSTLAFLREVGASDHVRLQRQLRVPIVDGQGRRSALVCGDLPSPFHLLSGIFDWPALTWRDRLAALRMAGPLRLARRAMQPGSRALAASPGETVENWLIRNGQTPRLRELLWEPLALAALNESPKQAAAPVFARVLAEAFGADASAAAIAMPIVPLSRMFAEPARRFIESSGGAVITGTPVTLRVESGGRISAVGAAQVWSAPRVISAVPWFALDGLFETPPAVFADTIARARAVTPTPIVTVNLWFDREVMEEPFLGLPGRVMQWVFDKRSVWGEGDHGASHLSLVSSGAEAVLGLDNPELIRIAHDEMLGALPGVRAAKLLRASVIREPRAGFSVAPGQPARPSTRTGIPGFVLAGDWIDTGLPATIESAVRSGHMAADAVMGDWVVE